MGRGFSVDLDAMTDAATGINETMSALKAHEVLGLGGDAGVYGHDRLADAVSGFCDRWQLGVENLAKDAQVVSVGLSESVQDYLAAEQSAEATIDQLTGQLRSLTTDPAARS